MIPVAIFTYKRLNTFKALIDSLKNNIESKETDLYIFSDGYKDISDKNSIDKIRQYISSINTSFFNSVNIIHRNENLGLRRNIISGLDHVLSLHDEVIVLEDDLIVSADFLNYMNNSLIYYKDKTDVFQVSAYMFPIELNDDIPDTFYYQANTCWGWGTWKRAWSKYIDNIELIEKDLKSNGITWSNFNSGQGREFEKQLKQNKKNVLNTWAVRWHSTIKIHNGNVVHPKETKVINNGFGPDSENCKIQFDQKKVLSDRPLEVSDAYTKSNKEALNRLNKYFKMRYSLFYKIKIRIKYYLGNV